MTLDNFVTHLQGIVDKRNLILLDDTIDDDSKRDKLAIFDKENDELNQSLDIFFRLKEYEGYAPLESLISLKVNIEDLPDFALFATKEELTPYLALFATKEELIPLAAKEELIPLALKTELPDITPLALKTELPDITPLALKTELPDLSPYALISQSDNDYGIVRGVNAHGTYLKLPDGTLVQFGSLSQQTSFSSSGNVYQSATGQKFTYPLPFLTTPFISAEAMGATGIWCGIRMASVTDFEIVDFQPYSTNSNITRSWFAIGKWK